MTLARYQFTVVDDAGNVQDGASVTVRAETVGNPLASLFSDRAGVVATGNPVIADGDGFAAFHVAGGAYMITATKGSFTRTWRYVAIGLMAETDGGSAGRALLGLAATDVVEFGALDLPESAPANPLANVARLYAFDDGGATKLGIKDSAGAIISVGGGAISTASGALSINGTPFSASVQSTGLNGIDGDQFFIFKEYTDAPGVGGHPSSEIAVLRVQRHADYTGGTFGNVENAIWARHTVEADVENFEWSILAQLENHATAGENVALYARADKRSGAGPTWAATYALQDYNTNPASGAVGLEIGMFANGTDSNSARVGLDVVAGKRDTGGSAAVITHGIRIGPQNSDATNGSFTNGIYLDESFGVGINLANASISGNAIALATGHKIDWNAGDVTISHASNMLTFAGADTAYSFNSDEDAGTATLRIHNTGDGNVTTKLSALSFYGTDTIAAVKEVVRIEAAPNDANWVGSQLRLYVRNSDAVVEAIRYTANRMPIWSLGTATPETLSANGQLTVTATSNTNLRFSYRGSDGTTRVANLTMA